MNTSQSQLKYRYPVELITKGRAHYYRVVKDGKEYIFPGVTGILGIIGGDKMNKLIGWAKKEALASVSRELLAFGAEPVILEPSTVDGIIARAKKKPAEILDAAADIGKRLHGACDGWIKGQEVGELADDLLNPFLAFKDWVKSSGINIVMGDTAVASIKHKYGGKFDFVFEKDGAYGIGDFKTSSGIREDYALQVAAYGAAAQETFGADFDLGLIVRFDKTAPISEFKWVKSMFLSFEAFLAAKKLKESIEGELYS